LVAWLHKHCGDGKLPAVCFPLLFVAFWLFAGAAPTTTATSVWFSGGTPSLCHGSNWQMHHLECTPPPTAHENPTAAVSGPSNSSKFFQQLVASKIEVQ
jgi:hypothetical protein